MVFRECLSRTVCAWRKFIFWRGNTHFLLLVGKLHFDIVVVDRFVVVQKPIYALILKKSKILIKPLLAILVTVKEATNTFSCPKHLKFVEKTNVWITRAVITNYANLAK